MSSKGHRGTKWPISPITIGDISVADDYPLGTQLRTRSSYIWLNVKGEIELMKWLASKNDFIVEPREVK